VTPEVEEEGLVVEPAGDLVDRVVAVQELGHPVRELVEAVEDEVDLRLRQCPADLGQLQRQQVQQRDLGREGLRGGDADLEPAAGVEHGVGLAGDLRAHQVRDRERPSAGHAGELHRVDRVARLARLGDADHERVA
jgi:hypothetical protein